MDRTDLERWVDSYERLWRTPGTAGLSELFSDDAVYTPSPFSEPHRGLDAIRRLWENERVGPDEDFTMRAEVVAVERDTGVVRVDVAYGEPRSQSYKDLWVIGLDRDGRCTRFEEWPFWPPGSDGEIAGAGS